eukprot:CAMPEP_0201509922 /NCGR_PEP_ID=MMETSP0161_2-20130828/2830_1 /ASSEMBLY_ACC=CAM_ASM_000251 /TAXON_ID=180227 /ORGANISM="Neoparamoeba aestuarina, Strain SoJaBio B1-5/56/2" /LENGTH=332 /DNA_ID=CAMNT_0047905015 /DNA_START=1 /DNA_END=999 /DNA_ORIENTATION=-
MLMVVGASNMDLIAYVPRFPTPGETLKGHKFQQGFGGKGANQAVAAASLGGEGEEVMMVTKVGSDVFGASTVENYKKKRVDTKYVFKSKTSSTGCAPIVVEDSGENSIVIIGGANDELTEEELNSIKTDLPHCKLLLCQMEIPLKDTKHALSLAKQAGVQTLLNTAPAAPLDSDILQTCSIIVANETEIHQILNLPTTSTPSSHELLIETARKLFDMAKGELVCVLVTLGSRGSIVITQNTHEINKLSLREGETKREVQGYVGVHLPVSKVEKVVDTTGAGDCFVGSFAFFFSRGKDLLQSARAAGVMAGLSVQKEGTQSSYSSALPDSFSF